MTLEREHKETRRYIIRKALADALDSLRVDVYDAPLDLRDCSFPNVEIGFFPNSTRDAVTSGFGAERWNDPFFAYGHFQYKRDDSLREQADLFEHNMLLAFLDMQRGKKAKVESDKFVVSIESVIIDNTTTSIYVESKIGAAQVAGRITSLIEWKK